MLKNLSIIALMLAASLPISAQELGEKRSSDFSQNAFKHLDASVTVGSTGVGLELSAPVNEFVGVRAGFDIMPRFEKIVNFGVQVGEKKPGQTNEDFLAESQSKFEKLSGFLRSFTGQKVEDNVDMIGKPNFYNFKLLVDIHPFAMSSSEGLRNFYVTAGFYVGNKRIAKAYNTTEDMPTLFSVNMYNGMYEKFSTDYYYYNDFLPGMGLDPDMIDIIGAKFKAWGRMGMYLGDYSHDGPQLVGEDGQPMVDDEGNPVLAYHKGDRYMMEPDGDCMVKATIKANRFKPYLGLGYATDLSRSKSGWGFAVDGGVLFWGGSPSIVTHDGTDLVNDLDNVRGKVGRYTDMIKGFKVYPVLSLKISKRLF